MSAVVTETSLSEAMLTTGMINMKQMVDMSSMQGPRSPLRGSVHMIGQLLILGTIGRYQSDLAIPNHTNTGSLVVNDIAAVNSVI